MGKELSEMTLDELWKLFPIILKEYNKNYPEWYSKMKINLLDCISKSNCERISHIGSTAVKGLLSKPTIDILLEIKESSDISMITKKLKANGWILMSSSSNPYLNYIFNKGYTINGFAEKVYHLHIRNIDDWDELYFRDFLINNECVAREYEKLKLKLLAPYKNNRDGYTEAKSDFIKKHLKEARKQYKGRYST